MELSVKQKFTDLYNLICDISDHIERIEEYQDLICLCVSLPSLHQQQKDQMTQQAERGELRQICRCVIIYILSCLHYFILVCML